jgi:hypothetical protein
MRLREWLPCLSSNSFSKELNISAAQCGGQPTAEGLTTASLALSAPAELPPQPPQQDKRPQTEQQEGDGSLVAAGGGLEEGSTQGGGPTTATAESMLVESSGRSQDFQQRLCDDFRRNGEVTAAAELSAEQASSVAILAGHGRFHGFSTLSLPCPPHLRVNTWFAASQLAFPSIRVRGDGKGALLGCDDFASPGPSRAAGACAVVMCVRAHAS